MQFDNGRTWFPDPTAVAIPLSDHTALELVAFLGEGTYSV